MKAIEFYRPIDQFNGSKRLLDDLKNCLRSTEYDKFYFSVAYAKSGPLLRLKQDIENWLAKGNSIEAIFGVNHH